MNIGNSDSTGDRPLEIVVIGLLRRSSIELLRHISRLTQPECIAHYSSIEQALTEANETVRGADLVIVIQGWPDQYSREAADQLVGHTLFGRLLCCYGPWCESDGRTRQAWPDSVRVPIRLAAGHIDNEVRRLAHGTDPVPPTAARDEVFTHRMQNPDGWPTLDPDHRLNAAVIGPDREYRRALAMALADLGLRSLNLSLLELRPGETARELQTSHGAMDVVIHDLDPWGPRTSASVVLARQLFPTAAMFGIATMPDGGLASEISDQELVSVIPKLDMELGLRWHLEQWHQSKTPRNRAASSSAPYA